MLNIFNFWPSLEAVAQCWSVFSMSRWLRRRNTLWSYRASTPSRHYASALISPVEQLRAGPLPQSLYKDQRSQSAGRSQSLAGLTLLVIKKLSSTAPAVQLPVPRGAPCVALPGRRISFSCRSQSSAFSIQVLVCCGPPSKGSLNLIKQLLARNFSVC